MKKIFTISLLVLIFSSAQSETIRKTYTTSQPTITVSNGFHTISCDGMLVTGKVGEPGLPYNSVQLLLPPGHEAVSISIEGKNKVQLGGYIKLYPVQHSRPLSNNSPEPFVINDEIYTGETSYPKSATGKLSTHFMNGYSYALCTFTPAEYNPAEGILSWYTSVTITIETEETGRASAALKNLANDERTLARCRSFAQNPEAVDYYPSASRSFDNYDILIITPSAFSGQMQSLVNLYHQQGLKTIISTTEYIVSHIDGSDMAEKMRNLIIHEYQNFGISQVILGGDVEHVTYRGFYCAAQSSTLYEDNNIPADLYFSALDGNWNTNGNQMWGEIGEDDLLPEISVGRLSFSTTAELASMINKTTMYQNHPVEGELRNHLFAGENLWYNPDTWGSDYLELLVGTQTENGYTTTGIPGSYPIERMYDETSQWEPQDLMNTINAGSSFINHVGHANENYTMKLYNWDITNSNFAGVNGTTHNFPIIYTHGCICGSFDANDCIGERMVAIDNFASAFVGNSRYGWFNEGQTEGPSAHLHREFIDALFTDSLNRIGSAHMESKIATAPWVNAPGQWEEGALRWCFYDCNVLGDPAMAIWTNEVIPVAATYPATISSTSMSFEVSVLSQGMPAQGLTVAAVKNGVLIGRGVTNQAGVAEVMLDSLITVTGQGEVVISGYNCKATAYAVMFSGNTAVSNIPSTSFSFYPNPADNYINLSLNGYSINKIVITNLVGKKIKEITYSSAKSNLKIPTGDINPGIYFLHFSNPSDTGVTKIIIQ